MKIYTKTGDSGQTSLLGGTRVSKAELKIESYGTVDELNAQIGLLSTEQVFENEKELIISIQHNLFNIGALLAAEPDKANEYNLPGITSESIVELEKYIDAIQNELPKLTHFVLPGGNTANGHAHLARCICRRAERRVVALDDSEKQDPNIIIYLNRLSDLLFVLSRAASIRNGEEERQWRPEDSQ